MLKKLAAVIMALTLVFSFTAPGSVDAAKYKSPKKSFTPTTPSKTTPNTDNTVTRPDGVKTTPTTTNPAKRGFFSGGGLLKGMMIGGLAGLLFGSLFGGMGFLGNLLGFMINILALVVLFVLIRKVVLYFINRRKPNPKRY